ncbi:MAG: type II toxin-antitoxin system HicB family antitoxin [Evtepia sp.]
MENYTYPAIFHDNCDGTFHITYPDLPACTAEANSLGGAIYAAQTALRQWIEAEKNHPLPQASPVEGIATEENEFVNLVQSNY